MYGNCLNLWRQVQHFAKDTSLQPFTKSLCSYSMQFNGREQNKSLALDQKCQRTKEQKLPSDVVNVCFIKPTALPHFIIFIQDQSLNENCTFKQGLQCNFVKQQLGTNPRLCIWLTSMELGFLSDAGTQWHEPSAAKQAAFTDNSLYVARYQTLTQSLSYNSRFQITCNIDKINFSTHKCFMVQI